MQSKEIIIMKTSNYPSRVSLNQKQAMPALSLPR